MVLSTFFFHEYLTVLIDSRKQIPLCQKNLNAPLRSRALVTTSWGQKLSSKTWMCTEIPWGKLSLPSSSLPCQSFALRWVDCDEMPTQAHCKRDTGWDGWGHLRESCSKSPLCFILETHTTGHPAFNATDTFRASQAEGSSAFKSVNWNWGAPASLRQVTGLVLQCGDTGPHQEVGSPHSGSCFSELPHHWFKTEKSQPGRQWHLIPEPLLDSSFTILFIFPNQWEKLTFWTWKLSQVYQIVPSFCSATLTFHFPKLKCFIKSYRQLFTYTFSSSPIFPLHWDNAKHLIFIWRFEEFSFSSLSEAQHRVHTDVVTCF